MRTCKKCAVSKPLNDFYFTSRKNGTRSHKCKDCTKQDVRKNRNDKIDYYREYDRKRGNRQPKTYLKEYREKYPQKYKAHNMVNNAIRDKKLFSESCEICGSKKTVAHHDDYAKPLNVRWLCQAHHKQWHAEHGEGLNT